MTLTLAGTVFIWSSCKKDSTPKGSGNPVITGRKGLQSISG
jgi:hypothetical protein